MYVLYYENKSGEREKPDLSDRLKIGLWADISNRSSSGHHGLDNNWY